MEEGCLIIRNEYIHVCLFVCISVLNHKCIVFLFDNEIWNMLTKI